LELSIRRPPDRVRSWWTDLPDDYFAKDPAEQPFRIVTVKLIPKGRGLLTYWGAPDGPVRELRETIWVNEDGTWTFEILNHPSGYKIFDEFSVTSKDGRATTLLHIRSTLIPQNPLVPVNELVERLIRVWRTAAEICERDTT